MRFALSKYLSRKTQLRPRRAEHCAVTMARSRQRGNPMRGPTQVVGHIFG